MEPISLAKNHYRGPNAHLLSLQQSPRPDLNLWRSFHSDYITYITGALNECLPLNYKAVTEPSVRVQIRGQGETESLTPRYPDSAVYQKSASHLAGTSRTPIAVADPDFIVQYSEPLADVDTWAVVIYKSEQHPLWGDPVTRIELLSRSNKLNGRDAISYQAGRDAALQSGTILYELDLLHESGAIWDIPAYPDQEGSHPYYIAITDPRQFPIETRVKGFNVDDPFPLINILLADQEFVPDFDFVIPYNRAFEQGRCGADINYAELPDPEREPVMLAKKGKTVPPAINTYSPADQERIKRRMQAVIDGVKAGMIR